MKSFLVLLAAALVLGTPLAAQSFAPANVGGMLFNGSLSSASGGANSAGTFTTLLAANGLDYTLSADGALSNPVPYTYTRVSGTTATLTEPAMGGAPAVNVALTFSSATAGSFTATYANGGSQQGTFTLAPIGFTSPLANVSTRAALAANGSAITGFVIGGAGPRRVLIRAIGPGLAPFGVSSPLPNPSIMLWRGSQQIGGNDDYSSGPTVDASLPQTFTQVGAFSLPPGSRDAALVTSLAPGAYTAQIRSGTANETGEVLMEVYFLD